MIDKLYEIVITAAGGNITIAEMAYLFYVVKNLISVCSWLIKHFEGVLKDAK